MVYRYVVTTHAKDLPTDCLIVMVDGTVPHWNKTDKDLHFDHHRPQGKPVQILEIPEETQISIDSCFVTTQVDADACAAAAWLQLLQMDLPERLLTFAKQKLVAIAYDCDHLGLPQSDEFAGLEVFARNAVATLKQFSERTVSELGLPTKRNEWSAEQKLAYASRCFQDGTNWLVQAALGHTWWPGLRGEARVYWANFNQQREFVYARCRLYRSVGIFDGRGIGQYVDPLITELSISISIPNRYLMILQDRTLPPAYTFNL